MRKDGQRSSLRNDIDTILSYHLPHPNKSVMCVDSDVGHDTTGKGSVKKPYLTINKAVSEAAVRDTIIAYGTLPFIEDVVLDVVGLRVIGLGEQLSLIRPTSNATPKVVVSAHGIELTGFKIRGGFSTGPGIQIIDSDYFNIHHNKIDTITGFDAIDKSAGSNIFGGKIDHNIIIDAVGAGIGIVSFREGFIRDNHIFRNNSDGIIMAANCVENEITNNKVFENIGNGIRMQGNNNYIANNIAVGNTVSNLEDEGTDNRWENNHTHQIKSDTHTTTGVAEETVTGNRCIQPNARVIGYLRLNNMVAGDDFIFRVKKSHNAGVTWDIIDETNLVGAQLIDRYNFDVTLENKDEWVRIFIQRQSAIDRDFYYKKIFKEG